MPRLIDANELYVDARCGENEEPYISLYQINDAPTVDAEPVKRGRWIKVEDDYNNCLYECSYCHTWTSLPTEEDNNPHIRYCWSCGAKMYR